MVTEVTRFGSESVESGIEKSHASQFPVGNQTDTPGFQCRTCFGGCQDGQFFLPLLTQARANRSQILVHVAGMTNKLPGSFWHVVGNVSKQVGIEMARSHDAERAVGGLQSGLGDRSAETPRQASQGLYLRIALPQPALGTREVGGNHFERITNRTDAASPRGAQNPLQSRRKNVRVFVCVNVGNGEAVRLQSTNLRGRFGLHLVGVDPAGHRPNGEPRDSIAKGVPTCRNNQAWKPGRIDQRLAIEQNNMAANTPLGIGLCESDRLFESHRIRHERGGGYDSMLVSLDDGSIHTRGEPEIVRIDDQATHGKSVAARTELPSPYCLTPIFGPAYTRTSTHHV